MNKLVIGIIALVGLSFSSYIEFHDGTCKEVTIITKNAKSISVQSASGLEVIQKKDLKMVYNNKPKQLCTKADKKQNVKANCPSEKDAKKTNFKAKKSKECVTAPAKTATASAAVVSPNKKTENKLFGIF